MLFRSFTGVNYRSWAQDMQAYLQTQECWDVVDGSYPYPTQPQGTPGTPVHGTTAAVAATPADPALLATWREDLSKWQKVNAHAVGAITLRLHHNLRHHCHQFAQRTWRNLAEEFGTASPSANFADFKTALSIKLQGGNPIPEIEKMATIFGRLATNNLPITPMMQGMILLAALPPKWDSVTQVFMQRPDLTTALTFANVRDAIETEYERHGQPLDHSAHKLSAVRRKGPDLGYKPNYQQSQQPGPSRQQQGQGQGQAFRPKRRGGKAEQERR